MGTPKLLLPWNETSVLGHLVFLWKQLQAAQVIVVCAKGDAVVQRELDRLQIPTANRACNDAPEQGMFSSVKCAGAFAWAPEITHIALVLGDQPHLRATTLQRLLQFASGHPQNICQPARGRHGRHPVILPREILREMVASKAATLKDYLRTAQADVALFETENAGFDLDIDYPEDYRKALRLSAGYSESEAPRSQPS